MASWHWLLFNARVRCWLWRFTRSWRFQGGRFAGFGPAKAAFTGQFTVEAGPNRLIGLRQSGPRGWKTWMMSKRVPTLTFMLFATGFACALYGLFVLMCDIGRWQADVRTFGTDPLPGLLLARSHASAVRPHNVLGLSALVLPLGLTAFLEGAVYVVRALEKSNIFIRL